MFWKYRQKLSWYGDIEKAESIPEIGLNIDTQCKDIGYFIFR